MNTVHCIAHDWEGQPLAGGSNLTRYCCRNCGAWGWRAWSRRDDRKLYPIKAYTPAVFAPREEWLWDHGDRALTEMHKRDEEAMKEIRRGRG